MNVLRSVLQVYCRYSSESVRVICPSSAEPLQTIFKILFENTEFKTHFRLSSVKKTKNFTETNDFYKYT